MSNDYDFSTHSRRRTLFGVYFSISYFYEFLSWNQADEILRKVKKQPYLLNLCFETTAKLYIQIN